MAQATEKNELRAAFAARRRALAPAEAARAGRAVCERLRAL
ncbi:MAG: 5-formyltetrahydrofolate cyclo-ligase, partial [Desulfovibrionaceae bacterium]|nr:5-formyltetrahydrofolate cyclo-ligase [Desulfovibrionaceae bacterium]